MCDFLFPDMRQEAVLACLPSAGSLLCYSCSFLQSAYKNVLPAHPVLSTEWFYVFCFSTGEQQCLKQTNPLPTGLHSHPQNPA